MHRMVNNKNKKKKEKGKKEEGRGIDDVQKTLSEKFQIHSICVGILLLNIHDRFAFVSSHSSSPSSTSIFTNFQTRFPRKQDILHTRVGGKKGGRGGKKEKKRKKNAENVIAMPLLKYLHLPPRLCVIVCYHFIVYTG